MCHWTTTLFRLTCRWNREYPSSNPSHLSASASTSIALFRSSSTNATRNNVLHVSRTLPSQAVYALSTCLLPQTLPISLPLPPPQSLYFALPPQTWHQITFYTSLHFPSLEPYPVLRILHFYASSNPSHLSAVASNGLSWSSSTNAAWNAILKP